MHPHPQLGMGQGKVPESLGQVKLPYLTAPVHTMPDTIALRTGNDKTLSRAAAQQHLGV